MLSETLRKLVLSNSNKLPYLLRPTGGHGVGGKGQGLLELPSTWYPTTIFISPELQLNPQMLCECSSDDREIIQDCLNKLASESRSKELIVRSSAEEETLTERGKFRSYESMSRFDDLVNTIMRGWRELSKDDSCAQLGWVVQPHIKEEIVGHMSNEHRVSRESNEWLIESNSMKPYRIKATNANSEDIWEDFNLNARTPRELSGRIREVANYVSQRKSRFHLEWLWDRERIWIVQSDRDIELRTPNPGELWNPDFDSASEQYQLKQWQVYGGNTQMQSLEEWRKISVLNDFQKANLPVRNVWVYSGRDLISQVYHDDAKTVEELSEDLAQITKSHVVVRCDLKSSSRETGYDKISLLPKTDAVNDANEILNYMQSTIKKLKEEGVSSDDIAFIAHKVIRARACAWSKTDLKLSTVHIDALWGVADGLNWLPHDTYFVREVSDSNNPDIHRHIKAKPSFLDIVAEGKWKHRDTPSDFIWRSTLSKQQLITIASGAMRLAKNSGGNVLTMWFIGILDDDISGVIPWYQEKVYEECLEDKHARVVGANAKEIVIEDEVDLADLGEANEKKVLTIRPSEQLFRDRDFMQRIISVASEHNAVVKLTGSSLAHPYYMLRRNGVAVIVDDENLEDEGARNQVRHHKLVRDGIPGRIEGQGESYEAYSAGVRENRRLLKEKLVEESLEVLAANQERDLLEELADLDEVYDAVLRAFNLSREEVERIKIEKRESRGGFDRNTVLVLTSRGTASVGDDILGLDWVHPVKPISVQSSKRGVKLRLIPPENSSAPIYLRSERGVVLEVRYGDSMVEVNVIDSPREEGRIVNQEGLF